MHLHHPRDLCLRTLDHVAEALASDASCILFIFPTGMWGGDPNLWVLWTFWLAFTFNGVLKRCSDLGKKRTSLYQTLNQWSVVDLMGRMEPDTKFTTPLKRVLQSYDIRNRTWEGWRCMWHTSVGKKLLHANVWFTNTHEDHIICIPAFDKIIVHITHELLQLFLKFWLGWRWLPCRIFWFNLCLLDLGEFWHSKRPTWSSGLTSFPGVLMSSMA